MFNLEQFVAEEADRFLLVKKIPTARKNTCVSIQKTDQIQTSHCEKTHSQAKPCADPTKVQQPSDQRQQVIIEKARIPVNAAPPQRGPRIILMEEGFGSIFRFHRNAISVKPLSNKNQTFSRRNLCSRTRWSSIKPKLMQIVFDPHPNTRFWNVDKWLDADASDSVGFFECCIDLHGEFLYIRSINTRSQWRTKN